MIIQCNLSGYGIEIKKRACDKFLPCQRPEEKAVEFHHKVFNSFREIIDAEHEPPRKTETSDAGMPFPETSLIFISHLSGPHTGRWNRNRRRSRLPILVAPRIERSRLFTELHVSDDTGLDSLRQRHVLLQHAGKIDIEIPG